jgi:aspartokinase/homoserine dehydrogenase 1
MVMSFRSNEVVAGRTMSACLAAAVQKHSEITTSSSFCQARIRRFGNDPLFKVKNGENALAFYSHYYQPLPLVLRGYGAGNDVTAAGVFADLLRTLSWKLGV